VSWISAAGATERDLPRRNLGCRQTDQRPAVLGSRRIALPTHLGRERECFGRVERPKHVEFRDWNASCHRLEAERKHVCIVGIAQADAGHECLPTRRRERPGSARAWQLRVAGCPQSMPGGFTDRASCRVQDPWDHGGQNNACLRQSRVSVSAIGTMTAAWRKRRTGSTSGLGASASGPLVAPPDSRPRCCCRLRERTHPRSRAVRAADRSRGHAARGGAFGLRDDTQVTAGAPPGTRTPNPRTKEIVGLAVGGVHARTFAQFRGLPLLA
jgi:hypothetical protein